MIARSVSSDAEIDQVLGQYLMQGYVVVNRSPGQASLFKKKELNGTTLVLCLVLGIVVCEIPLLIYFIAYLMKSDQMVQITVVRASTDGQLSPDGMWRLVNNTWVPSGNPPALADQNPALQPPDESFITPGEDESQATDLQPVGLQESASAADALPETARSQAGTVPLPEALNTPSSQESPVQQSPGNSAEEGELPDDSVTATPPGQDETVPMPDLTQEHPKSTAEGGEPRGT